MTDLCSKPSGTGRPPRAAVIGAGLSGLACASELARYSIPVSVFEKSRGPGGRTSTRRVDALGDLADFDHGAQYFTAREPEFVRFIEDWRMRGLVDEWAGRIVSVDAERVTDASGRTRRLVGVPGMSAVCHHLAARLDIRYGRGIQCVRETSDGWELLDPQAQSVGCFDVVISTAPAPQTSAILEPVAPDLSLRAATVQMQPCWALMVAFDTHLDVAYEGAFVNDGPLSWIARTSSKPLRSPRPDRWVIHANPGWSAAHLEEAPADTADLLLEAFFAALRVAPVAPTWFQAHRWRYASALNPLAEGFLFDADLRIGACGDWANGNRVEGAFLSGIRAAREVAQALGRNARC